MTEVFTGPRRAQMALFIALASFCGLASASELRISRDALQALVVSQVFTNHGKWYLAEGNCYAFIERPRVSITSGRLIVDGHFSSRMGIELTDSCVGTSLASDVRVSGRIIGAGSRITLDDIRMDDVKDEATRQALELLQAAAGTSLPKAVDIDLLQVLKPTILPGTPVKVEVTNLQIIQITPRPDGVTVQFEAKLNAR
jgi:hypothetical protein